jgi:hypothetical protein
MPDFTTIYIVEVCENPLLYPHEFFSAHAAKESAEERAIGLRMIYESVMVNPYPLL